MNLQFFVLNLLNVVDCYISCFLFLGHFLSCLIRCLFLSFFLELKKKKGAGDDWVEGGIFID